MIKLKDVQYSFQQKGIHHFRSWPCVFFPLHLKEILNANVTRQCLADSEPTVAVSTLKGEMNEVKDTTPFFDGADRVVNWPFSLNSPFPSPFISQKNSVTLLLNHFQRVGSSVSSLPCFLCHFYIPKKEGLEMGYNKKDKKCMWSKQGKQIIFM